MPRAETQSELRLEELRLKRKRRQRFWGALVLIAVAVIALPLLLDGAGTQSQFRRVESLQEEPESSRTEVRAERTVAQPVEPVDERPAALEQTSEAGRSQSPEGAQPDPAEIEATTEQGQTKDTPTESRALLTAWVVQAAVFSGESEALQLRDRLRQSGFASFVRDREANADPFRVLVGPMIKEATAQKVKIQVVRMLNLEFPSINPDPEIMVYP